MKNFLTLAAVLVAATVSALPSQQPDSSLLSVKYDPEGYWKIESNQKFVAYNKAGGLINQDDSASSDQLPVFKYDPEGELKSVGHGRVLSFAADGTIIDQAVVSKERLDALEAMKARKRAKKNEEATGGTSSSSGNDAGAVFHAQYVCSTIPCDDTADCAFYRCGNCDLDLEFCVGSAPVPNGK